MIRWPWRSQEERDATRWDTGRQGAFACGMRQAAARDFPGPGWQPGPVPPPRQVRRQERELAARRDPADDSARTETLARAMEQSLRHDRARRRAGRGTR